MKDRIIVVVACESMAAVSPVGGSPFGQHPFPTPSPFSFSVASTRWSTRPTIDLSSLFLRLLALLFSFVSAISLAASQSSKKTDSLPSNFTKYPSLIYCFVVVSVAFVYSAFQLLKGVFDIVHRGIFFSDSFSDYASFVLDQLVVYVLVSSSSVAIPVIQQIEQTAPLWKIAIVAVTASFGTFVVLAICTVLSGYKLCKRIIW